MSIKVDAVYEAGVFKPEAPLQLKDKSKVTLTIEEPHARVANDDDPTGWKAAERFIGMFEGGPAGEPIAREHDKHLYK
jgi:predicted DNA-binding antitoxin AbrB/MazE fold protein